MSQILPVFFLSFVAAVAADPIDNEKTCKLIIEGQGVEQLVLTGDDGKNISFVKPESSISLKPGTYLVSEIHLKGKYHHYGYYSRETERIVLADGESRSIRIGGPLSSHVEVERTGRILELNYTLQDSEGRKYHGRSSSSPEFVVYQNGRKIGSGEFEYG